MSTIIFENQTFSLDSGVLISASTSSPLIKNILALAKNTTEDNFVEAIEKVITDDEISAGKFWNKDPHKNSTTGRHSNVIYAQYAILKTIYSLNLLSIP